MASDSSTFLYSNGEQEFEIEIGSPTHQRLVTEEKIKDVHGIAAKASEPDDSEPEPDGDGGDKPLDKLSRVELNERALAVGVEDPEDLPNRGAVIDEIKIAENEPEPDDSEPEPDGE